MALFAKTTNSIVITGMNIPIPFSETEASPDNVSDRYTNTPNKNRFVNMLSRPKTNCNCLFLNKKIATIDKIADTIYNKGILLSKIELEFNKSVEKIISLLVLHNLKTNVKPPEIIPATNK